MSLSLEMKLEPRRLLRPASLLLAASNLVPIVGVLAWGWDVFLVLVLYWFETAIVAFWTVLRIACMPGTAAAFGEGDGEGWKPVPLALFFTVHSGIFIGVHFMFLWGLFAGEWPRRVDGVGDFFRVVVLQTGLWIPLLVVFLAHGLGFLRRDGRRDPLRALGDRLFGRAPVVAAEPEAQGGRGFSLGPLYGRIIGMQLAIILGGMLSLGLGSMAPLLLLMAIKTFMDAAVTVAGDGS